jgi:hypothetical protein
MLGDSECSNSADSALASLKERLNRQPPDPDRAEARVNLLEVIAEAEQLMWIEADDVDAMLDDLDAARPAKPSLIRIAITPSHLRGAPSALGRQ